MTKDAPKTPASPSARSPHPTTAANTLMPQVRDDRSRLEFERLQPLLQGRSSGIMRLRSRVGRT